MKKIKLILAALAAVLAFSALATCLSAADAATVETKAKALKSLGLFRGVSDTEFDLDRSPTRVEALVMLIRTLGNEKEATGGNWKHPFSDVPSWADKYVGYAYEKGLTKGVSDTEFGTGNASAATYVTFMLRALGYSDSVGDFSWQDPFGLAKTAGILPETVDLEDFLRADVVEISFSALKAKIKDSKDTLGDRLISMGAFTANDLKLATTLAPGGGRQIFVRDPNPAILPVEPKDPLLPMDDDGPAIGD